MDIDIDVDVVMTEGPSSQYLGTLVPKTMKGMFWNKSPEMLGAWTLWEKDQGLD